MKTNKYLLLPFIILMTSCYIYKPYKEKTEEELAKQENSLTVAKSLRTDMSSGGEVSKAKREQVATMTPGEIETLKKQKLEQNKKSSPNNDAIKSEEDGEKITPETNSKDVKDKEPKIIGIKEKLQPNKYYKISALGNQYKIQVDKWEGDTLVSHKIRKPEKIYKLHMNDIDNETVLERVFSKPFSDLLTIGAYASGAAIVLLLVL